VTYRSVPQLLAARGVMSGMTLGRPYMVISSWVMSMRWWRSRLHYVKFRPSVHMQRVVEDDLYGHKSMGRQSGSAAEIGKRVGYTSTTSIVSPNNTCE
jgi:hypothetical protein